MSLEPETVVKDVKRWLKRNYLPVISRVYFNLFAHICRNHQVCFLSFHFSFTFSVSDTWIPLDHVGSIAQGKVIGHIGHHMPQIDILTDAHMITHDKDIFTSNSHACSVNHVSTRSAWAQHESSAFGPSNSSFQNQTLKWNVSSDLVAGLEAIAVATNCCLMRPGFCWNIWFALLIWSRWRFDYLFTRFHPLLQTQWPWHFSTTCKEPWTLKMRAIEEVKVWWNSCVYICAFWQWLIPWKTQTQYAPYSCQ